MNLDEDEVVVAALLLLLDDEDSVAKTHAAGECEEKIPTTGMILSLSLYIYYMCRAFLVSRAFLLPRKHTDREQLEKKKTFRVSTPNFSKTLKEKKTE